MPNVLETMQVKSGEKVSRTKSILLNPETGDTVRLCNVSNNAHTGQNYKVDWTFNFADCSPEEILDLAARSAVIAYRKHFKGVKESEIESFEVKVINVKKDVIAGERVKKSPVAQVKSLLEGMGEDERKKVLADLGL